MSNTKLKPCPFCGEENNIYLEKYEHAAGERWRIFCAECMAQIDRGYDQIKYGVIEAWNTRKPMDNIVAELEKESDFFGGEPMGSLQKAYYCKGVEKAIDIVKRGGVK